MRLDASNLAAPRLRLAPFALSRRALLRLAFVAIFAASLSVYVSTLAPTVMWYDMGEFATTSATLGIAHNTGYPLLILLGKLFTFAPVGDTAYRVNLLSAVATALATAVVFSIILELTDEPIAAIVGAMILAFSGTVWANATWATSYGLNLLLTALIFRLMLAWWRERATLPLAAAALVFGLGLCNHRLIVLAAPACAVALVAGWRSLTPRAVALAAAAFVLGLSVYVYLPLRASQHPMLSWAQPANWHTYWSMFLNGQTPSAYWRFDLAGRIDVLWTYPAYDLTWPALALAAVGLALCAARMRLLALAAATTLALDALVVETYSIHNIYNYLTPAYLVLAVLAGIACAKCIAVARDVRTERLRPALRIAVVTCVLALVPAALFARHHARVDRSADYSARDFAQTTLDRLPPRAVVLADTWTASPLWYLQMVEGQRRDVLVSPIFSVPDDDAVAFTRTQLAEGRPVYAVDGLRSPPRPLEAAFHLQPVLLDSIERMVVNTLPKPEYRDELVATGSLYAVLPKPADTTAAAPISSPLAVSFAAGVTLTGFATDAHADRGDVAQLQYDWQAQRPLATDVYAATIFLDDAGTARSVRGFPAWSQVRQIGQGARTTSQWQPGETVRESYYSLVPRDLPPGRYVIRLAVFDGSSGADPLSNAALAWSTIGRITVR